MWRCGVKGWKEEVNESEKVVTIHNRVPLEFRCKVYVMLPVSVSLSPLTASQSHSSEKKHKYNYTSCKDIANFSNKV